jgi:hypothetical protein
LAQPARARERSAQRQERPRTRPARRLSARSANKNNKERESKREPSALVAPATTMGAAQSTVLEAVELEFHRLARKKRYLVR